VADPQGPPFRAVLGRFLWMVFGPVVLLLTAVTVMKNGDGWLSRANLAFFVTLGLMLLGRCLEFHSGWAQTVTGKPATRADLRHYLITASAVGLLTWVVANLLSNYWWAG
jgi:hypothetical protein